MRQYEIWPRSYAYIPATTLPPDTKCVGRLKYMVAEIHPEKLAVAYRSNGIS